MANDRMEKLIQMMQEDPHDLFVKYALAMEYAGRYETDRAIDYLRKVIDEDPNYMAAYYQLGKLLDGKGQQQEAIYYYEKGLLLAQAKKDLKTSNEFRTALDELLY
jgi:tetratricopeptide (TPR) repeat protein